MPRSSISFVLPMYNEARTIGNVLRKLASMAKGLADDYEIVIADDGSDDGSGRIIDGIAQADPHVRVVHMAKNTKFGGALKAGIGRARNDIIIYTDSDLPVDLSDINKALPLLDGADIVTAYSAVKKGENFRRVIMSQVYNFLIQLFFRPNIKDINSGFKIYRKKVFEGVRLISNSPFIDVEIFVRAMRKNCIIRQCPVVFKRREDGKSYISRPAVVLKTIADMVRFKISG
ncbi:MAG: hypothetical protein A2Z72_07485 [Omnitrophica bacterium RBG_13_46_9]|nr:MAG: hypothetical protein A2Z72_07485 [Omnitrophica bacterium RBG_13_46_9]